MRQMGVAQKIVIVNGGRRRGRVLPYIYYTEKSEAVAVVTQQPAMNQSHTTKCKVRLDKAKIETKKQGYKDATRTDRLVSKMPTRLRMGI